jgi:hypothetical protein
LRNQDKARCERTGIRTVDEAEAAEDSPTLAEVGQTGEVGVVAVEAEVEGVAAPEAEDEHPPPLLIRKQPVYFFL